MGANTSGFAGGRCFASYLSVRVLGDTGPSMPILCNCHQGHVIKGYVSGSSGYRSRIQLLKRHVALDLSLLPCHATSAVLVNVNTRTVNCIHTGLHTARPRALLWFFPNLPDGAPWCHPLFYPLNLP